MNNPAHHTSASDISEIDFAITVCLCSGGGTANHFSFLASDVLAYHSEQRTWTQLADDPSHAQISLSEDYALYQYKRQFGDDGEYEVNVVSIVPKFKLVLFSQYQFEGSGNGFWSHAAGWTTLNEAQRFDEAECDIPDGEVFIPTVDARAIENSLNFLNRKGVFSSPHAAFRLGEAFTFLGNADPCSYDVLDSGVMYRIRFDDNAEIMAWPEEVKDVIGGATVTAH